MSHSFDAAAECHVCHIAARGWASRSVAKLCRAAPRGWEMFGQQILHAQDRVWKLGSEKLLPHPLPTAHLQMERGWVTAMMWWQWWKWEQTKEGAYRQARIRALHVHVRRAHLHGCQMPTSSPTAPKTCSLFLMAVRAVSRGETSFHRNTGERWGSTSKVNAIWWSILGKHFQLCQRCWSC